MGKKARTKGKHELRYTVLCDWCGEHKETSREDTKTCGGRCRQRLAAFVNWCGYPPDHIQGPITAKDAIDRELGRLLEQERRRRAAARALVAG
jgi:hypothetical protein